MNLQSCSTGSPTSVADTRAIRERLTSADVLEIRANYKLIKNARNNRIDEAVAATRTQNPYKTGIVKTVFSNPKFQGRPYSVDGTFPSARSVGGSPAPYRSWVASQARHTTDPNFVHTYIATKLPEVATSPEVAQFARFLPRLVLRADNVPPEPCPIEKNREKFAEIVRQIEKIRSDYASAQIERGPTTKAKLYEQMLRAAFLREWKEANEIATEELKLAFAEAKAEGSSDPPFENDRERRIFRYNLLRFASIFLHAKPKLGAEIPGIKTIGFNRGVRYLEGYPETGSDDDENVSGLPDGEILDLTRMTEAQVSPHTERLQYRLKYNPYIHSRGAIESKIVANAAFADDSLDFAANADNVPVRNLAIEREQEVNTVIQQARRRAEKNEWNLRNNAGPWPELDELLKSLPTDELQDLISRDSRQILWKQKGRPPVLQELIYPGLTWPGLEFEPAFNALFEAKVRRALRGKPTSQHPEIIKRLDQEYDAARVFSFRAGIGPTSEFWKTPRSYKLNKKTGT